MALRLFLTFIFGALACIGFTQTVTSVGLSPQKIIGGSSSTCTVTLSSVAPTGGVVVTMTSEQSYLVPVPSTVTVPAGSVSTSFTITAMTHSTAYSSIITATCNSSSAQEELIISPDYDLSVTLNPSTILDGGTSTGTVTVQVPAPSGGWVVNLTSQHSQVTVPSTVTVPAGATSATFPVTTTTYGSNYQNYIAASDTYSYVTAVLSVYTAFPSVSSVALSPQKIISGASSTCTVTLSSAAPVGGSIVSMTAQQPYLTPVPSTITVPAGATSASFTITSVARTTTYSSIITASYNNSTAQQELVIAPDYALGISINPSSILDGGSTTGTVTVQVPAPAGGWTVTLVSQHPQVTVPSSVTVPAGATSATFLVTTTIYGSNYLNYIAASDTYDYVTAVLSVYTSLPTVTRSYLINHLLH